MISRQIAYFRIFAVGFVLTGLMSCVVVQDGGPPLCDGQDQICEPQCNLGEVIDANGDCVEEPCNEDEMSCNSEVICPGGSDTNDIDNDGIPDACDLCPTIDASGTLTNDEEQCASAAECLGKDATVCPPCLPNDDDDEDGICNGEDICDGGRDDVDTDEDGIPDGCDLCPGFDASNILPTPGDQQCVNATICENANRDVCACPNGDSDGDGFCNGVDPCENDRINFDDDGDSVCANDDICRGGDDALDSDGDGVPDFCDICVGDDALDADEDGVPDACDTCPGGQDDGVDTDGDSIPDFCDICPLNPNNPDADGDDVCDDFMGIPDIVATRVAFIADGDSSASIDISGIAATIARVTVLATDRTETSSREDNFAMVRMELDVAAQTYSGSLSDFGGDTTTVSQFAWIDQAFGSAAGNAANTSGSVGNARDVMVDLNLSSLVISFPTNDEDLEYAIHVEFLDGESDSLQSIGSVAQIREENDPEIGSYDVDPSADVYLISGNGFQVGSNFQNERKMVVQATLVRDITANDGTFRASGVVAMQAGSGDDRTVTYGFEDYVVGPGPGGAFTRSAAPGTHDTDADNDEEHDLRLYFSSGQLIIEETDDVAEEWTNSYRVQSFKRTALAISTSELSPTFSIGDTSTGNGENDGDFHFPIPAGASTGKFLLVAPSSLGDRDNNENSGLIEVFVDLTRNTISGTSFGIRSEAGGDLVSWYDVSLDMGQPLIDATGLALGVVSNRSDIDDFADPQFGDIIFARENVGGIDSIRVRIGPGDLFGEYDFQGGLATWTAR